MGCNASRLAVGIRIEINGEIVVGCFLVKEGDLMHINLAEFEVLVKGINLALKWKLKI